MATTYAIPDGRLAMAATLYTGNATSSVVNNSVNGVSFRPDFVWIKSRGTANQHNLIDSVRGVGFRLRTDGTNADEATPGTFTLNSNGFTTTTSNISFNGSGDPLVGWQWKGGGTPVSNTAGSITSSVSANPTAGFSVVTWTGTGSNATVGHGLGVAPAMIINKPRNAADNWISWHTALGSTGYIYLNLTNASATGATVWNSTLPTSTVFSVGTSSNVNSSAQTMVSYCFAPVAGYSAFGSYTGNGSADGPFVYLGFKPRWILIKQTDSAGNNWFIVDTSRSTYNVVAESLLANLSDATYSYTVADILSNGFKLRNTGSGINANSGTYIYMAFAENPFKYANAR